MTIRPTSVIDPPRTAAENMAMDEALLTQAEAGIISGIYIRFYSWVHPAISFGYRQAFDLVDQHKALQLNVELVKRVTGGGMVFHQPNELTYCLVAENKLFPDSIMLSCNQISQFFIKGLQALGVTAELAGRAGVATCNDNVCFARPTKYEVLVQGRKLIGSAQKRGKLAFMQHGSLALNPLDPVFAQITDVAAMAQQQISLEEIVHKKLQYADVATALLLSGELL